MSAIGVLSDSDRGSSPLGHRLSGGGRCALDRDTGTRAVTNGVLGVGAACETPASVIISQAGGRILHESTRLELRRQ